MGKIIQQPKLTPLSQKRQALLDTALSDTTPPKPIITVNRRYCVVNNNATALRNLFLIPWLIGLCYTCYVHVDEFFKEWNGAEWSAIDYIKSTKLMYGDNYFEITQDSIDIRKFNRINKQGVMTFEQYMHDRYNYYVGGDSRVRTDIFLVALYGIGIPGLLIWIIRFRRQAPLYFDRERQLLYTWWRGKAWVQRYEPLKILENASGLRFVLNYKRKNGTLDTAYYMVQPSGNPLLSSVSSFQPLLAYLVQYMAYGKGHVLPEQADFNLKTPFYFYDDEKPADFEQQLEQLLLAIDESNDEPPLDKKGIPIAK